MARCLSGLAWLHVKHVLLAAVDFRTNLASTKNRARKLPT